MDRTLISSGSPFEAQIGYSRAVAQGDWVFVSGTTGFDYATMTIADDVAGQTQQCLRNIDRALAEAGATLADVVRVHYVLPDAADFPAAWPALQAAFGQVRPAAMMIEARLLDPRMRIEIEVTALKRGRPGAPAPAGAAPAPQARIVEGWRAGCIGRIAQLHALQYAAGHGFGAAFEAGVARELGAFCEGFRPGRDGLWLALVDERIEAAVALQGPPEAGAPAHLRWFIASPEVRGHGIGRRLLQSALALADASGCTRTVLWTFAGLDAARHLYEAHGFRLVHEAAGDRWGAVVQEQRFERLRG